jgi:hypothetical protein
VPADYLLAAHLPADYLPARLGADMAPGHACRWFASWEEAKDVGHNIEPTMFPDEATAQLPLERCMRFLPHHQVHIMAHMSCISQTGSACCGRAHAG